jgi:outer membrane autotransporter protein
MKQLNPPAFTRLLRGGRITKWKGKIASCAPLIGLVVVGLGVVPAFAADECGSELAGPDIITCNADGVPAADDGNYEAGITYTNSDGLTLNINAPGIVVASPGVSVQSSATNINDIAVNGTSFSVISTTGANQHGILALNSGTSGDATVTQAAGQVITTGGSAFGLYARNSGNGTATATLTAGDVSTGGTNAYGLYALNSLGTNEAATSATMEGGSVTTTGDGARGLFARNSGNGTATATLTAGDVSTAGTGSVGLYALNSLGTNEAATSATMVGGSVTTTGDSSIGIFAFNWGNGTATATLTAGDVHTTGVVAAGLSAQNSLATNEAATSATMEGGSVTTTGDGARGLNAVNQGNGTATVTLTAGDVLTSGDGSLGLHARNTLATNEAATSATMVGGSVTTTGDSSAGIFAYNQGNGTATVTLTAGDVSTSGDGARGLLAVSQGNGTATVTLTAGDVLTTGDTAAGLSAEAFGAGSAAVLVNGGTVRTNGNLSYGVQTVGSNNNTIDIVAGAVIDVGSSGIAIRDGDNGLDNNADGFLDAADNVYGQLDAFVASFDTDHDGVRDDDDDDNGFLDVDAGGDNTTTALPRRPGADGVDEVASGFQLDANGDQILDGNGDPIPVATGGSGNVTVTTAGTVTGGAILGLGDDVFNLTGGAYSGTIIGDDAVASTADGDDTFNWSGGTLVGGFRGQNGSDTALVTASSYDGSQVLDGGDDLSTADGWIDTLTLQGLTATTSGANLTGWENLIVDGGTMSFTDELVTGSSVGTGLIITNGGTVNAGTAFALTGNMMVHAGATFAGTAARSGVSVTGSVSNSGLIDLSDGAAGNVLSVGGNWAGSNGVVRLDVALGDSSSETDRISIGGDASGSTALAVQNAGGLGAQTTGDGILLVEVEGTSAAGAFTLAGPVDAGAFFYTLSQGGQSGDGNFYLVSSGLTPAGSLYVASPAMIAAVFPNLTAMADRYAGRIDLGRGAASNAGTGGTAATVSTKSVDEGLLFGQAGAWLRLEGDRSDLSAANGNLYDLSSSMVKAGYDTELILDAGRFVIGGYLSYGRMSAGVTSLLGSASMSTDGYGLGLTGTYFATGGTYVDLQLAAMWLDSDLSDAAGTTAATGVSSTSRAASIEIGRILDLPNNGRLIPSAQYEYKDVNMSDFVDTRGNVVTGMDDIEQTFRMGVAWDTPVPALAPGMRVVTSLDYLKELSPETMVQVGPAIIGTELPDDWVELGLGFDWATGDSSNLSLRTSYRRALGGGGDNNTELAASLNFEVRF